MKIREIKYLRKFKFFIDSNSKASRFAKLSTCKDGSNLQFAKLSPREIKVFYSILTQNQPILACWLIMFLFLTVGAGADFVMLGGMFAGHDQSGGETIERNGKKLKLFYGMSSATAMNKHAGGVAEYR